MWELKPHLKYCPKYKEWSAYHDYGSSHWAMVVTFGGTPRQVYDKYIKYMS